ncbi:helix-turn-helix domain-containing protein [Enterococcus bulliens]
MILKELADHFHYNYSYLSSLFPQVTEMNFTDYMNELRIKRAKDLLKQVDVTISEVAESIGFTDISYFSKVFKKRTGQTPSQYRRGIEHV